MLNFTSAGKKSLTRHEMDLERAIAHGSDNKSMANMLLETKDTKLYPAGHPMNNLKELLHEIAPIEKPLSKKEKKKRKKALQKQEEQSRRAQELEQLDPSLCVECYKLQKSKRDVIGPQSRRQALKNDKCVSCRKSVAEDESDSSEVESIPEDVVQQYKLTVEQIRQLPRFQDYATGQPNKVI